MSAQNPDTIDTSLTVTTEKPSTAIKNLPIATMIAYRRKGLSIEEIGKLVGCSKQNVYNRMKNMLAEIDSLDHFKDNRADTLAYLQTKLLNTLTDSEVKKISPGSRITGAAILYDKERLERGKSSVNIAYADYTKSIDEIDAEIARIEDEME